MHYSDYIESTINYPCRDNGEEICIYTQVQSVKDGLIKRNPNCRIEQDNWGWMLYYPRAEIRHPRTWVKVSNGGSDDQ